VQVPGDAKKLSILHTVVDDYFRTFGISVLKGRAFGSGDAERRQEAVLINRMMAESLWPGQEPVGKTLLAGDQAAMFAWWEWWRTASMRIWTSRGGRSCIWPCASIIKHDSGDCAHRRRSGALGGFVR
jgi:hypothetical protein